MHASNSWLKDGYRILLIGSGAMAFDLVLQFLILREECCGVVDYVLFRDIRGIVECSLYPFIKVRILAWLGISVGLFLMLISLIGKLFSIYRT